MELRDGQPIEAVEMHRDEALAYIAELQKQEYLGIIAQQLLGCDSKEGMMILESHIKIIEGMSDDETVVLRVVSKMN